MKRNNFFGIFLVLVASGSSASVIASTITLKECFGLAILQSETLQINKETIRQIGAERARTRASALPDVRWEFSNIRQDTSGVRAGASGSDQTSTRKSRTTSNFTLVQPLFSGLAEFSAMSSLLSEKEREEFLFKRAHENLYAEVARVYYDVLKAEADLANIRTNIQLTQDRIGELKERERLGKSRRSELLSSQSQFESLRSLEADALGAIAHDREALSFLTGKDMSTVELVDELNPNEALVPLDNALARADNRLDIQAFKADEDAKRKAIYVARAGYSPTADVTAHYYTQRPGLLQDVDWDVIFNVDVPIFQGGGVHSASVEAVSRHREAELNLTRLRRSVQSEVRNALTDLKTSLEQAERLESAYDKAHESYQLHVKEYRLGLVNNLEVLASQNAMQATRHDRDQAVLDSRVHAVNFKLAVGDSE